MIRLRPPRAGGYTKREFRRITRWLHGLFPQDGWVAAKEMAWTQLPDLHFNTRHRRMLWLGIKRYVKQLEKNK